MCPALSLYKYDWNIWPRNLPVPPQISAVVSSLTSGHFQPQNRFRDPTVCHVHDWNLVLEDRRCSEFYSTNIPGMVTQWVYRTIRRLSLGQEVLREVFTQFIFATTGSRAPTKILSHLVLAHHVLFIFISTGVSEWIILMQTLSLIILLGKFCSRNVANSVSAYYDGKTYDQANCLEPNNWHPQQTAQLYGFFCSKCNENFEQLLPLHLEASVRWKAWRRVESTKKYVHRLYVRLLSNLLSSQFDHRPCFARLLAIRFIYNKPDHTYGCHMPLASTRKYPLSGTVKQAMGRAFKRRISC